MSKTPKNQVNPPRPVDTEIARRLTDRVHDLTRKPRQVLWIGDSLAQDELSKQFPQFVYVSLSNSRGDDPADALLGVLPPGADLPALLTQALPRLAPDSPILLATLGVGSFAEMPSPPKLPEVRDIGDVLQKLRLSLPVVDRDRLTLTFADAAATQRTFEAHGWPLPPDSNFNISKLTIEIIYIHAHAQGPGQPAAAKRGSGKVSLVNILHDNSTS